MSNKSIIDHQSLYLSTTVLFYNHNLFSILAIRSNTQGQGVTFYWAALFCLLLVIPELHTLINSRAMEPEVPFYQFIAQPMVQSTRVSYC